MNFNAMRSFVPGRRRWTLLAVACAGLLCSGFPVAAQELRLGIVGTDSSHSVEFTRLFNDAGAKDHVDGARVVAAYRGGNLTFPLSRDRIQAFTAELAAHRKIPFVPHIRDLCSRVDGLLLLSVDPGLREREFEEASACGKPIFVDKPFAPDLQTARRMERFAAQHKVVWFSSSAMRFGAVQTLRAKDVRGADVWGPGALGKGNALDLSWYAIHSIGMLYAVMGPGAQTVSRLHTPASDVITGVWPHGRIGSVHIVRPDMSFGVVVFYADGHTRVQDNIPIDYGPLLHSIVSFMHNRSPPVDPRETLEIFEFMDAAQRSMRDGGAPVHISNPR